MINGKIAILILFLFAKWKAVCLWRLQNIKFKVFLPVRLFSSNIIYTFAQHLAW